MSIEQELEAVNRWLADTYDFESLNKREIEIAHGAYRAALQSQDREDAERIDFMEKEWFYRDPNGVWTFSFNECWEAGRHENLREAIDHARRVEGEGK
ncbi:hypothetical protein PT7_P021 (plasmid) [Pusillimonas sp. T7-7]|uniref:hypothetical protein n=1 Tax=Pusillimonas sp. (strain T7-7) TaxID=1007105 RepID=UPI0002084A8C|nr:hypothetical protein [Pusillimonas sp. T7-7]AEC22257.1 hypothetical protein PT7_P021 [Pusillimonas sp. T7-7]